MNRQILSTSGIPPSFSLASAADVKPTPPPRGGKLILVRHGRTVLNSLDDSEKLWCWLDVPLDDQGLKESEETARHVAQYPATAIYCSDLQRAQQTAAAIARATPPRVSVHSSSR